MVSIKLTHFVHFSAVYMGYDCIPSIISLLQNTTMMSSHRVTLRISDPLGVESIGGFFHKGTVMLSSVLSSFDVALNELINRQSSGW